jgi:hypothetical protein
MRANGFALAGVVAVATIAMACATMRVGSYVARGTDFARYQTYAWAPPDPLPIGDPRLDHNPIFTDYLQGAVERGLGKHHLLLVPTSAAPDLLIHFHGSVRQVLDVATAERGRGVITSGDIGIIDYDEGTLVLDMIDARTNALVWRGWAIDSLSGILETQDRMEQKLDEAVTKMLANFSL